MSLGFLLAIENAEVIGLDIDRYAVETYNFNLGRLGGRAYVRDVLRWKPEGDYDVVVGGPPCQPFSLANTRKRGREHPLYPTFPRFFDVVLELKPKVFLLENVKGLVTKRHRQLLAEQLERVEPYYRIRWQVLNVAHYGVPQRRERLFVLGIRRDLEVAPSFPRPTHAEKEYATVDGKRIHRWVTVREAIGDLLAIPPQGLVLTHKRSLTDRVLETTWKPVFTSEEPRFTVTNSGIRVLQVTEHVMTEKGGWTNPKSDWGSRILDQNKPSYTITEKHRSGQLVRVLVQPTTEEAMARPCPTLVADARIYATGRREKGNDTEKGCYRRLTVRECLRLQSFPDWWRFPEGISTSRKYRLVGEAVPPILAYRLATHIAKLMGWRTREPPKPEEWQLPYFERAFADYME